MLLLEVATDLAEGVGVGQGPAEWGVGAEVGQVGVHEGAFAAME